MDSIIKIDRCGDNDLSELIRLRRMLWPESSGHDRLDEIAREPGVGGRHYVAFVARTDAGEVVGFAEASLRHDPVNGCDTSPVLFLEGIYVVPVCRRRGIATSLCAAAERWGRALGCSEFGSDALLDNATAHAFHTALGFEECERVVVFRKLL